MYVNSVLEISSKILKVKIEIVERIAKMSAISTEQIIKIKKHDFSFSLPQCCDSGKIKKISR